MTKGLEALDKLAYLEEYKWAGHPLGDEYAEEFRLITKELKALEIIKNKLPHLKGVLTTLSYRMYEDKFTLSSLHKKWKLTEEEYNLLMEVLS